MNGPGSQTLLLFRRFAWTHWRRSPRTTLLLVLILALGVAVFLSIRLANRAAVSGFTMFTDSIAGESDFLLQPVSGNRLNESLLPEIRDELNPAPALIFPVLEVDAVEKSVAADGPGAESYRYRLVGVDLVALRNAAMFLPERPAASTETEKKKSNAEPIGEALGSDSDVLIGESLAESRGFSKGDSIEVALEGQLRILRIAGVLPDDPLRPAVPENLLLMDLPGLQEAAGAARAISRIEIRVPPGHDAEANRRQIEDRLQSVALGRWRIETPDTRREDAAQMTQAFRTNLTILSTLALLVGTYLILQALEAAVVRRRPEIAILRSLGVEPKAVRRAWLLESFALGLAGSLLGIVLGRWLAGFSVGAIARTVDTLYFNTTAKAASLDAFEVGLALAFGITASLLAGWLPAREAAGTPPAQVFRSGSRSEGIGLLKRPLAGVVFVIFGVLCGMAPPLKAAGENLIPLGGYFAAFAWLIGISILAGLLFRPLSIWVRGRGRKVERAYAASQLRRPTGRQRLATAGLVVAIGMASGMGILVASFESTLTHWIGHLLRADLYVSAAGAERAGIGSHLPENTWRTLAEDPQIESFDVIRQYPLQFRGRGVRLSGSTYHQKDESGLKMIWLETPDDPDTASLAREPEEGEILPAWVNEPFSRRFDLHRDEVIEVDTAAGKQSLRIEGVYADYSDESGTILVSRRHTSRWFSDGSITSLAGWLKPGIDPEQARARWLEENPALLVRTNQRLRSEALRVFRQTFSVTHALEAIGVFVAVAGLGMALAGLLLERRTEMTTLKSLGFSRPQIARASAWEGVSLATAGIIGGFVLSLILGWLLIHVINRQSFGWTLDLRIPVVTFALLAALTLLISAVVSAGVGYWGGRLRVEQEE